MLQCSDISLSRTWQLQQILRTWTSLWYCAQQLNLTTLSHPGFHWQLAHFLTSRVHILSVRFKLRSSSYPSCSQSLHSFLRCVFTLLYRNVFHGRGLPLPYLYILFWSHRLSFVLIDCLPVLNFFCLLFLPSFLLLFSQNSIFLTGNPTTLQSEERLHRTEGHCKCRNLNATVHKN